MPVPHAALVDRLAATVRIEPRATRSMASLHAAVGARKVLGLSATPWRSDRLGLCFERSVRDAGIRQLVVDGYLSPFAHYALATHTPTSLAEAWLREPDRWGRTLVFFRKIAECQDCAGLFAAAGVACEVVSGASDREAQIERFEAAGCQVMLSVAVLAEGFDCPGLKTVFCRPSGRVPAGELVAEELVDPATGRVRSGWLRRVLTRPKRPPWLLSEAACERPDITWTAAD